MAVHLPSGFKDGYLLKGTLDLRALIQLTVGG
jgi:hypothetical protein